MKFSQRQRHYFGGETNLFFPEAKNNLHLLKNQDDGCVAILGIVENCVCTLFSPSRSYPTRATTVREDDIHYVRGDTLHRALLN